VIVLTAAAGMNPRRSAMFMLMFMFMIVASMNRVRAVCLIVRHQNSPGPLNYIP
jgi:hypothetical protein